MEKRVKRSEERVEERKSAALTRFSFLPTRSSLMTTNGKGIVLPGEED